MLFGTGDQVPLDFHPSHHYGFEVGDVILATLETHYSYYGPLERGISYSEFRVTITGDFTVTAAAD